MPKEKSKLNLGCGKRILSGYINIDVEPFSDKVIVMDVRSLEFADESIDEILAEQVLEHLPYFETQEILWEWWRVLRFGGVLKIVVPDFEKIARAYLGGKIDRDILHFSLFNSIVDSEKQTPHLCTFDKSCLRQLLEKEGFQILEMKNKKLMLVAKVRKINKENLWN